MRSVRRLAAILASDVSGYSRLMGSDEEGTHERLKAHLGELVDPKIKEHRGRVVKNTGDGFLAEFASVVDAVRCAVEIQRGMAEREPEVPEERRIRFRIGINLGDVIAEDQDIFGDGVNVAARLEALAEPGGICISRVVRDQVRDRLDYTFEDMGEQQVKNIARPVRVHRIVLGEGTGPSEQTAGGAANPPLALPDKPSIAVLPFQNMSDDPEQEYFADGTVEEIITALSRIRWLFGILAHVRTPGRPASPAQPLFPLTRFAPTPCLCPSLTQSNRRGTDPYARWWGRGGIARCPPIPILGATLSLPRAPAKVCLLNPQPALRLPGGNCSFCPEADPPRDTRDRLSWVVSSHSFPSSPGEVCQKPTPRLLGQGEFLCRRVEASPGITTTHPDCSSGQASSIQLRGYVL